jgi:hypothetical protein
LIKDITPARPASGGVFENQTTRSHAERERTHKQGQEHDAVCADLRRTLSCRDLGSREGGRHPTLRIDSRIGSGTACQLSLAIIKVA